MMLFSGPFSVRRSPFAVLPWRGVPKIGRRYRDAAGTNTIREAELLWKCVISRQCFDGCELAGAPRSAEE